MKFWASVTGSDIRSQWSELDARAAALPADYQAAWEQIKQHLWPYSSFTARNLTPIRDSALGLLEEAAADGLPVAEVLGEDIKGFAVALAGGEGARTYRDRWREQLNASVARKLSRQETP